MVRINDPTLTIKSRFLPFGCFALTKRDDDDNDDDGVYWRAYMDYIWVSCQHNSHVKNCNLEVFFWRWWIATLILQGCLGSLYPCKQGDPRPFISRGAIPNYLLWHRVFTRKYDYRTRNYNYRNGGSILVRHSRTGRWSDTPRLVTSQPESRETNSSFQPQLCGA